MKADQYFDLTQQDCCSIVSRDAYMLIAIQNIQTWGFLASHTPTFWTILCPITHFSWYCTQLTPYSLLDQVLLVLCTYYTSFTFNAFTFLCFHSFTKLSFMKLNAWNVVAIMPHLLRYTSYKLRNHVIYYIIIHNNCTSWNTLQYL